MKAFSIKEMLADFSRLLRRVTAGKEVIIKRAGTPVAGLVPVEPRTLRVLGTDVGVFTVLDGFNVPSSKMDRTPPACEASHRYDNPRRGSDPIARGRPIRRSGVLTRILGTSTMTP